MSGGPFLMSRFLLHYVIVLFLSAGLARQTTVTVEQVATEEDWNAKIKGNGLTLVHFYAPWCGHCQTLEPEFEAAAVLLHQVIPEVLLVKVDATQAEAEELAMRASVVAYPTLKLFRHGEHVKDYQGPRTSSGIVSFIEEQASAECQRCTEALGVAMRTLATRQIKHKELSVGAVKEIFPEHEEKRVAITPENVTILLKSGFKQVLVEKDAGADSQYSDEEYAAAGATLVEEDAALKANVVLKLQCPTVDDASSLAEGTMLIFFCDKENPEVVKKLEEKKATVFAMDLVPRTDIPSQKASNSAVKFLLALGALDEVVFNMHEEVTRCTALMDQGRTLANNPMKQSSGRADGDTPVGSSGEDDEAGARTTSTEHCLPISKLHPHVLRNTPQFEMLLFLYNHGVMKKKTKAIRTMEFDMLINPLTSELPDYYTDCKERLARILRKEGDDTSDVLPSGVQSFEQFAGTGPWSDPRQSFVFWRDHTHPVKAVQRVQKSQLCYFHGVIVHQHFLVARTTPGREPGMIDMVKFIRERFSAEDLEARIFHDRGGDSEVLLEHVLMPNTSLLMYNYAANEGEFIQMMKKFGPALVSKFHVYESFQKEASSLHVGLPPEFSLPPEQQRALGMHAMVAVGYRWHGEKEKQTLRVLLQNWWPQKQFVEVDLAYLKACKAHVVFVETPQPKIPDQWATEFKMYAETELLDMAEQYLAQEYI